MSADRIKEIRERVEKASPGPWDGIISSYAVRYLGPTVGKMEHGYEICGVYEGQYQGADKEFIAEARQDIPWLLTELESAQAELARLKSQLADALKVTTEATIESMSKLDKYGNRIK